MKKSRTAPRERGITCMGYNDICTEQKKVNEGKNCLTLKLLGRLP